MKPTSDRTIVPVGRFVSLAVPFCICHILLISPAARGDYAREVLKDKPVAWWRFADKTTADGAPANDETGRNSGVYRGGVTPEAGPAAIGRRAVRFDGRRAYINVPHKKSLAISELSVEFWVKSKQPWRARQWPGSATLITKATGGAGSSDWTINAGALQGGKNEGRILTSTGPAGSNADTNLGSGQGLNDGKWHHVVWTRSADGVNFLYIDGQRVDRAEDDGGPIANTRPLQIGGDPKIGAPAKFLDGALAELAIYATVLDAARVRAHAVAGGAVIPVDAAPTKPLETLALKNSAGLSWELWRGKHGWSLGQISLNGKPLEHPTRSGILALRNVKTGQVRWLPADKAKRFGPHAAGLSGETKIGDSTLRFDAKIALQEKLPAATWTLSWSVDKDLQDWQVCLAYHETFNKTWRVQSYPWAANNKKIKISPMRYCGVPGALVYRPDQSVVALFAIDSNSDYLNPTTWRGKTEFHFASGRTAPQFRVGGGGLTAGVRYEMPLQLIVSDAGEFAGAITGIMQAWINLNNYRVDDTLKVRTPQEAFNLALEGRRKMRSWKPGIGYEHHRGTPFIYVGNNPIIAYYEYRLHELTGEKVWRKRAVAQIDYAIKGQQPSGVFHTSWNLRNRPGTKAGVFCSWDWAHNGYKVDINAWMVRCILQTWQRVKKKEGVDRKDWYKAALASLNWVLSQQNPDGGFPQVVNVKTGARSQSVVCGRMLVGLPIIAKITGNARCLQASARQEQFLRKHVEGRFWYTGSHPDSHPGDFEQDSIYCVVEYWLDKHDRTGDEESLARAVANAYYALLFWCPRQLSWVKSPTQAAHSEQQNFNQYSVYCYHNRKIQCLDRLFKKTGNRLFKQLRDRVMQLNFYVQVVDGPYKGSVTEAIADPWLERRGGYEWRGSPYTSELVSDLMLQLMDMGLVKKP